MPTEVIATGAAEANKPNQNKTAIYDTLEQESVIYDTLEQEMANLLGQPPNAKHEEPDLASTLADAAAKHEEFDHLPYLSVRAARPAPPGDIFFDVSVSLRSVLKPEEYEVLRQELDA